MGKQSKSRGAALGDSPLQARMSATTSITDLFSSGAFDYRAIRAIGGAGSGANASRERQPRISSFGDSQGNVASKRASISRACSRSFLPIDPRCKDGPRAANRKSSAPPHGISSAGSFFGSFKGLRSSAVPMQSGWYQPFAWTNEPSEFPWPFGDVRPFCARRKKAAEYRGKIGDIPRQGEDATPGGLLRRRAS